MFSGESGGASELTKSGDPAVATVALTKETFEETVSSNEMVFVDLWASWCGPCRMFGPVFESASERHDDIVFAKVDTEAEFELAGALGIMSIPTLMVFRDGILLYSQAGALPAPALEELVGKVRELDMDDIRRQIDQRTTPVS